MIGTRAKHQPGGLRPGHERKLLGQQVAGFQIWHQQDAGAARDL
jgi:hypothetical protein